MGKDYFDDCVDEFFSVKGGFDVCNRSDDCKYFSIKRSSGLKDSTCFNVMQSLIDGMLDLSEETVDDRCDFFLRCNDGFKAFRMERFACCFPDFCENIPL